VAAASYLTAMVQWIKLLPALAALAVVTVLVVLTMPQSIYA
jgi:hypothetical protein